MVIRLILNKRKSQFQTGRETSSLIQICVEGNCGKAGVHLCRTIIESALMYVFLDGISFPLEIHKISEKAHGVPAHIFSDIFSLW